MQSIGIKLINDLKDLKENYGAVALKAEFAAEGSTLDEIKYLKQSAKRTKLDLVLKIGGCEAVKDLYDIKSIGVNSIVAPMIETKYALKKFINSINTVYSEEERKQIKTYINIETITAFKNIESMVNTSEFESLSGIVLGRSDMARSFELESGEDVDSERILNIATALSLIMKENGKEFVIGGGVSSCSLSFFEKVPYLTKTETRKIVFSSPKSISHDCLAEGIKKALEFELLWLKNKENFGGCFIPEDEKRINILNSRLKTETGLIYG